MIALAGCFMRQQKIESEDQRAADAAAAAVDAVDRILAAEAMPRIATERKRRKEECAANSMAVHGRMLSALVVKKSLLYREASSQSKAIVSLMPGEQVKVEESSIEAVDDDGKKWTHAETSRLIDCPPYEVVTGWLDKFSVVETKDFKSVDRWDGPAYLEVEAGEWIATYYFSADGTYRSDEYRGKLYRHGDVFLGRAELNGEKIMDVFLWVENKGICWGEDPSYCQK
jgi:hypothetical protein